MKLNVVPEHWKNALSYFTSRPEEAKYIPHEESDYLFIKTDTNRILALARKKLREDYVLGKGNFSIVITAEDETGKLYACRIYNSDYKIPHDHSLEVMMHLGTLKGMLIRQRKKPKEVKSDDRTFISHQKGYQILELAEGETLEDILIDTYEGKRKDITGVIKDMIALNCCLALLDYQAKRVIHGDLSSANILVSRDQKVTFVDNGFSLILPQDKQEIILSVARGTLNHAAPEIMYKQAYSFESDLYALGEVFRWLNRLEWSRKLKQEEPGARCSLYEMISLILYKISRENKKLNKGHYDVYCKAKKVILQHYHEKLSAGITLNELIRNLSVFPVMTKVERYLVALLCCRSFHQASVKNAAIQIKGSYQFIVKKLNNTMAVTFCDESRVLDYNNLVFEQFIVKFDESPEKNAIYALGRILEYLGIELDQSVNANPLIRTPLLVLMSDLALAAKSLMAESYAEFEELDLYIREAIQALALSTKSGPSPVSEEEYASTAGDEDRISSNWLSSPALEDLSKDANIVSCFADLSLTPGFVQHQQLNSGVASQSGQDYSTAAAAAVIPNTDIDRRMKCLS